MFYFTFNTFLFIMYSINTKQGGELMLNIFFNELFRKFYLVENTSTHFRKCRKYPPLTVTFLLDILL